MNNKIERNYQQIIKIELWNHGSGEDPMSPCGEVDVFTVSGNDIHIDLLDHLTDKSIHGKKFEWFGELPTEEALRVSVAVSREEDGFWLNVLGYDFMDSDVSVTVNNQEESIND